MTNIVDEAQDGRPWWHRGYGSPYDRGSADAYYGRSYNPHWYPIGVYNKGLGVNIMGMTPEQIEDYRAGYTEETDQKDWG